MQSKNSIVFIAVGFIAVIAAIFLLAGRGKTGTVMPAPGGGLFASLTANATVHDFGTISMASGKVSKTFTVVNTSNTPLALEKLTTSCMCTSATFVQSGKRTGPFGMPGHGFVPPLRKTLAPKEEAEVQVTYDPAAHGPAGIGPFERAIFLENAKGETLMFKISGTVTP